MWVTRSEREWRRREEARGLAESARQAEARIAGATSVLRAAYCEATGKGAPANTKLRPVALGRGLRLGKNGRAEGLAVLEGVVLARVAARILAYPPVMRWLLHGAPENLAALSALSDQCEMTCVKR